MINFITQIKVISVALNQCSQTHQTFGTRQKTYMNEDAWEQIAETAPSEGSCHHTSPVGSPQKPGMPTSSDFKKKRKKNRDLDFYREFYNV